MIDFTTLLQTLDTKGTKVFAELKHSDAVASIVYANVSELKENIDNIISQYLPGYQLVSTLEGQLYKCSCNLL